jgi:hypothetical protein
MKKLILAFVTVAFGFSAAAHACDGMKGHEKADKGDQGAATAKKDGAKSATKSDQKS